MNFEIHKNSITVILRNCYWKHTGLPPLLGNCMDLPGLYASVLEDEGGELWACTVHVRPEKKYISNSKIDCVII